VYAPRTRFCSVRNNRERARGSANESFWMSSVDISTKNETPLSAISIKGSVLIVDDDESVRDYLRILLEQAGYSVIAVADGQLALAYLARVRADVILLDLMMPVVDGWTFAEAVRADQALGRIPIIVFSAAGDPRLPGAVATLIKPSTAEELLATVERVLAGERRRNRRYAARFDVHATSTRASIHTTTRDVSSGGLSFDCAIAPTVGERLRLQVELATHGVAAMEVEVRHVAPTDGGWHVGTRLLALQSNAIGFNAALTRLAQQ